MWNPFKRWRKYPKPHEAVREGKLPAALIDGITRAYGSQYAYALYIAGAERRYWDAFVVGLAECESEKPPFIGLSGSFIGYADGVLAGLRLLKADRAAGVTPRGEGQVSMHEINANELWALVSAQTGVGGGGLPPAHLLYRKPLTIEDEPNQCGADGGRGAQ